MKKLFGLGAETYNYLIDDSKENKKPKVIKNV